MILKVAVPPGAFTLTLAPARLPSSALPIGQDLNILEHALEGLDAAFEKTHLFLGLDVVGVLGQVALLDREAQARRELRALDGAQILKFLAKLERALGGEVGLVV